MAGSSRRAGCLRRPSGELEYGARRSADPTVRTAEAAPLYGRRLGYVLVGVGIGGLAILLPLAILVASLVSGNGAAFGSSGDLDATLIRAQESVSRGAAAA